MCFKLSHYNYFLILLRIIIVSFAGNIRPHVTCIALDNVVKDVYFQEKLSKYSPLHPIRSEYRNKISP